MEKSYAGIKRLPLKLYSTLCSKALRQSKDSLFYIVYSYWIDLK